jgi:hypothetical protein
MEENRKIIKLNYKFYDFVYVSFEFPFINEIIIIFIINNNKTLFYVIYKYINIKDNPYWLTFSAVQ